MRKREYAVCVDIGSFDFADHNNSISSIDNREVDEELPVLRARFFEGDVRKLEYQYEYLCNTYRLIEIEWNSDSYITKPFPKLSRPKVSATRRSTKREHFYERLPSEGRCRKS